MNPSVFAFGPATAAMSLVLTLMLWAPLPVHAHEPGMVELTLDSPGASLRAELDLVDLDYLLGLDSNADGAISALEVGTQAPGIVDYVAGGLEIQRCRLRPPLAEIGLREDTTPSVVVDIPIDCDDGVDVLGISSTLFDDLPDYRTVLLVRTASSPRAYVLRSGVTSVALEPGPRRAGFLTFVEEGITHIMIGVDHIAFLLILVLPLALRGTWRVRLRATAGIVTAFTVAHSITLSLAALGQLSLPARPVELTIALSVVLAGCLNVVQRRHVPTWPLAYGFGLIHGFGFAGALSDLAIADGLGWTDVLAFNLGVELGQLLIVAVTLPLLSGLAKCAPLRRGLVPVGSLLVAGLGVFWMLQRW